MGYATGGIVGYLTGTSSMSDSTSYGSIKGRNDTGGVAGHVEGTSSSIIELYKCYNRGTITGVNESTGGIVGAATYSTLQYSDNYKGVTGVKYTGGLVGYSYYSNFYSWNYGSSVSGGDYTGGVVGSATGSTLSDADFHPESSASVTGYNYTGGVVGYASGCTITNCDTGYSGRYPTISGYSYVGGIAGYHGGSSGYTLTYCNSYARVKGETYAAGRTAAGGIVGYLSGSSVRYCNTYNTVTNNVNKVERHVNNIQNRSEFNVSGGSVTGARHGSYRSGGTSSSTSVLDQGFASYKQENDKIRSEWDFVKGANSDSSRDVVKQFESASKELDASISSGEQNKIRNSMSRYAEAYKEEEKLAKLSEVKGNLKKIEWGSQIRSYVMCPYTLVKDNESGYETSSVDKILDGDIGEMLEKNIRR